MHRSGIALAAFAGLAFAQNSTVQFFWPDAAVYEVPAVTVQSVNASATVLHIACPTSQASSCEWGQGMDYTIFNSSTYEATMTGNSSMMTRTCEAKEQGDVNCFMEGKDEKRTELFAVQEHWSSDAVNTVVGTVDSGVEKLRAAPTGAASSFSPSAAVGSSATATASSTNLPQATGAAGENRAQSAFVLLCAAAATLYM